jgi:putative transposase
MSRRKKELGRTDERLNELLLDFQSPEDILGESGLLKQLSQRLIERALAEDLSHHLKSETLEPREADHTEQTRRNSRNGYSSKTIQSQQGAMELATPPYTFQDYQQGYARWADKQCNFSPG